MIDTAEPVIKIIEADWDVPSSIHAVVTTRMSGYSLPPYDSFNPAKGEGDSVDLVDKNRVLLTRQLSLPSNPRWMNQSHGTDVVGWSKKDAEKTVSADASWSSESNVVCVVMTADCLPVFFYHPTENKIAVAHAGWRGLLLGVLENTLTKMTQAPKELMVWFGPAIGAKKFEVGDEVKQAFCCESDENEQYFEVSSLTSNSVKQNRFLCDIYSLAKLRLQRLGVSRFSGGEYCTVSDSELFYSFRRDGITGRMANLIWRTNG